MYSILRPLFFRLDPERAHQLTLRLVRLAGVFRPVRVALRRLFCLADPRLEVRAFGLKFANPFGLAAGYDKDGAALAGSPALDLAISSSARSLPGRKQATRSRGSSGLRRTRH
jgi:dihydroorotate dehydrogenase